MDRKWRLGGNRKGRKIYSTFFLYSVEPSKMSVCQEDMSERRDIEPRKRIEPTGPTCLSSYFEIDRADLVKKGSTYIFKESGLPASGRVLDCFPGGQIRSQGGLLHGFKHGLWEYFYENEQLEYWCHYVRGKKDWYGEYYDEKGELSETESWDNGVEHGPFKCYERGRIVLDGAKHKGVFDGPLLEWYPNGQIKRKFRFKKGVNHGLFCWWYPNGQLEQSTRFVNGDPIGRWEEFYENGNRRYYSEFAVTGERFGWTREYAENGVLLLEQYIVNGKRDMVSRSFYPSGHLKNEREYKDGLLHGHERSFSQGGQLTRHTRHEDGKILSDVSYLPQRTSVSRKASKR